MRLATPPYGTDYQPRFYQKQMQGADLIIVTVPALGYSVGIYVGRRLSLVRGHIATTTFYGVFPI